ncbi:MAG: class I mannose-6-phosphate isomerase [Acidobacteria bacterium]|nr:class I mannose-6-phosphate isomerase [Acidobacteriota bacterium]
MPDLYPLLLLPDFRERVWGARDLSPVYPNYNVEGEPIGEVWLTGDECRVANGPLAGQTLGDLAKRYGRDLVGKAALDPQRFPLLVKFLFPREKLSVQVHPDDETARRSGLPHGKSECWYVVAAEIHAQVGVGLMPGTSRADFEAAVRRGDRADALLNWIYVKPGEMIYNPAGTVHAIGPGSVLLEVQQNSDVTYRLYDYGRPRELHLELGLAAMREETSSGRRLFVGDETMRSLSLIPHFHLLRYSGNSLFTSGNDPEYSWSSVETVVGIEGCGVVEVEGRTPVTFGRGDAVVVPACVQDFFVRPQWSAEFLTVTVPPTQAMIEPQTAVEPK